MRIGIAGKIGSGKSTVSRWFVEKKNYYRIDMDAVGHMVLEKNADVHRQLQEKLPEIFIDKQLLSRREIGKIVFRDKTKLQVLNSILHPAMKRNIFHIMEEHAEKDIVIDGALLYEMGIDQRCDYTILVKTPFTVAQSRSSRAPEDFENIWKNQKFLDRGEMQAHFIVENSGSTADLYNELEKLYKKLRSKS